LNSSCFSGTRLVPPNPILIMAPKRAGAKGAGRPAKKAKTEDPVKEAIKVLNAAFDDEDQVGLSTVPEITKEMLGSVIATSLGAGAAADERHDYQAKMADAIGEVLKEVVKIWEGKVVEAQGSVTAAEATKTEKDGIAATAESTLATKTSETEAAQETLAAAKAALAEAGTNLGKCKDAVDKFDVDLVKKENELGKVKGVLTENFEVLKAGVEWATAKEQKEGEKKHLGPISTMLKTLHADTSLMSALQSALTKKPAERGQFDAMAIEQLETILTSKITELESHINNAESIKAAKVAAVSEAETTLADSEAAKTKGEEDLEAAKKAQKEAQTALKDSKKAVDEQESAVEEAKGVKEDADTSLELAKKGVGQWEYLISRTTPPPEPEPPAAEEAPAEAAPAEAVEEPAAAEPEA